MTIEQAITLIEDGQPNGTEPVLWVDLGCGSGLFSRALASFLPDGSRVICIDRDAQHFKETTIDGVYLEFAIGDFGNYDFGSTKYDGFLLANSIHYIQDKNTLLENLRAQLKPSGRLLLVEYDSRKSNEWVPYPIPFADLVVLSKSIGFTHARRLGERDSIYGLGKMYSCEIMR